jgi:alkylation response protein AidB-like acyl-CoA dehydrogenase
MNKGLDKETLDLTLEALKDFTAAHLPEKKILELDATEEFPVEIVREMCGSGLGIQLLFIPEEFEGMGGGAFDIYRVCEELARVDLGVATGVLATFLGSDPIIFGGTYDQRKLWMTRIGQEGLLMAYGATEPEAGSDLAALRTVAEPVLEDGKVKGYKITGNKQWMLCRPLLRTGPRPRGAELVYR